MILRQRAGVAQAGGSYRTGERAVDLDPQKTAVIICDMWNEHWCVGATRRVAEMAPRMNAVVKELRRKGALIIHAPSGTMVNYAGTPQRRLALEAEQAETPVPLRESCPLDESREAPLPVDDSDGGCDCSVTCSQSKPWSRQIDVIEIEAGDAIAAGLDVLYLMQRRGRGNAIIMGVAANMCVLGRPFGIRQLVYQGKNTLLVRDMTDVMYNSRMEPRVSHFRGLDLVIEHIERFWCPTITSDQIVGGEPFRFREDEGD